MGNLFRNVYYTFSKRPVNAYARAQIIRFAATGVSLLFPGHRRRGRPAATSSPRGQFEYRLVGSRRNRIERVALGQVGPVTPRGPRRRNERKRP